MGGHGKRFRQGHSTEGGLPKRRARTVFPRFFPAEIANALLVAERRGRINPGEFTRLLADILTTTPRLEATIPLLPLVVPIVNSFRVSIYDALYVALAQQEQCDMLTDDVKLITNLQQHYPFIKSVSSLP